jgi:3-oxoacyl-[acyl-carrier protein] reductase
MNGYTDLKGKNIVVFGSTRKIGRHVALAYAAAGAKVVVTGRDPASGERVEREAAELGGTAHFVKTDITDYASVEGAIAAAVERFGGLDVMVASASGRTEEPQGFRPFSEIAPEEFLGYSLTHWVSKLYCIKAALPVMRDAGGGKMVIITSDAGRTPTVGESLIGGGAAASMHTIRTLAKEFIRWRITINAVAISITDTGDGGGGGGYGADPSFAAKMFEKLAARQVVRVEGRDVAAAALYLGSDAARAITGQSFSVNGGISV